MRICIVTQEYPPETGGGGIGTQAFLKATGLSARGHHVEVVSASWENPRSEQEGLVCVHRIHPCDFGIEAFDAAMQWMGHSFAIAKKLEQMKAEENFDILQFPEYGGEGFVHQTNNFAYRKARYSVQMHGPLGMFIEHMGWPEKNSALGQVGCFMEMMSLKQSDGLLASSHNSAKFCAEKYELDLEKINVIHSGIDITRFSPQEPISDGGFPRILFVGNLAGNKGFSLLVETVVRMKKRYPNIRLRTIGKGDDSTVAAARKRVAAAGAEENVEFSRYVPYLDLPKHYAWCDLFAGPSLYEPGPGNVYLEAMSCGRPVIACNTAGAPEVVLDEKTGLLIPTQDSPALEAAIVRLAENAELRRSLGNAGRKWVVENFSIQKYTDKVERFYQGLMEKPIVCT